jgi:hypothetical protein
VADEPQPKPVPPGLARKGEVPPGLAKKGRLPPGLAKKFGEARQLKASVPPVPPPNVRVTLHVVLFE